MRGNLRYLIALIVGGFSLITYYCNRQTNPVTGETQHVNMTTEQEIALGLQAAPEMAQQYGGLYPDQEAQNTIDRIGNAIIEKSPAIRSPYKFDFHLLADDQTINAFALPGGQVFVTAGLVKKLSSEGQVAGVLAHEIGHVIERHSAQQLAKSQLTQGLSGAAAIGMYDSNRPGGSIANAAIAAAIAKVVSLRFSREDELEADRVGVAYVADAGYDPRSLLQVMQVLEQSSGGGGGPEFLQTHPNPGNRNQEIQQEIQRRFPNGVPAGLKP